jgi:hypothetical protein
VAVGTEDGTFGGFGEDAFLPPVHLPESGVDRDFFLIRIVVMEFEAGGVIFPATSAPERGLEFGEPSAESSAAALIPLDLDFTVLLIPGPHVAALVLAAFFGIFERH